MKVFIIVAALAFTSAIFYLYINQPENNTMTYEQLEQRLESLESRCCKGCE